MDCLHAISCLKHSFLVLLSIKPSLTPRIASAIAAQHFEKLVNEFEKGLEVAMSAYDSLQDPGAQGEHSQPRTA